MAYTVNRASLLGNAGKAAEMRYTAGGVPVCNFSLATRKVWKNKAGEKQERTDWHRITVWGAFAEVCGQRIDKGSQVYVEGEITYNSWVDKEGHKKVTAEIVASQVVFTGQAQAEGLNKKVGSGGQMGTQAADDDLFGEPGGDREPPF